MKAVGVSTTEESEARPAVKSADRALIVLEHLAWAPGPHTLNTLHHALGVPKSSLHGLLRTLREREWVEVDESGTLFRLGVRALLVGTSYIDTDEVVAVASETLDQLAIDTEETVHLGRLDGPEIVYLATRQSQHSLRLISRVGRRLPAHTTALGKVLLAHRPPAEVDALLPSSLERLTPNSIADHDALRQELNATRARGYAVDREENTLGITCIAFALPGDQPPSDAISISVPLARFTEQRAAEWRDSLQAAVAGVDVRLRARRSNRLSAGASTGAL